MMNLTLKKICLLAVIGLTSAISTLAWDDVGHKITGYIAWQRMSPAARSEVIRILRSAPEDSHLSAFYLQYGPLPEDRKQLQYFELVPTWADIVRDRTFKTRYDKYHKSTWHYSDTFWRQVNGKIELITDKQPGGQGVVKLVDFDREMRDPAISAADKAIAIAWFLHVGGDLHQPLHTSGRHTDLEPNGDQGGNLFLLTPAGTKREDQVNLHWFWDSIVGRNYPLQPWQSEGDYIRFLSESMMTRHPYDTVKDKLMLTDYAAWQRESFAYAPSDVFRSDLVRFQAPSADYLRNAYAVSEQRLALAGYRLGDTLEQIYGK